MDASETSPPERRSRWTSRSTALSSVSPRRRWSRDIGADTGSVVSNASLSAPGDSGLRGRCLPRWRRSRIGSVDPQQATRSSAARSPETAERRIEARMKCRRGAYTRGRCSTRRPPNDAPIVMKRGNAASRVTGLLTLISAAAEPKRDAVSPADRHDASRQRLGLRDIARRRTGRPSRSEPEASGRSRGGGPAPSSAPPPPPFPSPRASTPPAGSRSAAGCPRSMTCSASRDRPRRPRSAATITRQ